MEKFRAFLVRRRWKALTLHCEGLIVLVRKVDQVQMRSDYVHGILASAHVGQCVIIHLPCGLTAIRLAL